MPPRQCFEHITPEMAKAVWESFDSPSTRKVADAFKAVGRPIHQETIRIWRRHGWKHRGAWRGPTSPAEQSTRTLDIAFGALTGDPRSRVKDLRPRTLDEVIKTGQERMEQLAKMPDNDSAQLAGASNLRLCIVLSEEIARQSAALVKSNPQGLAILLTGLAQAYGTTLESGSKLVIHQRNEDGAIIGEVLPPERGNEDPMSEQFAAWGMSTQTP